MLTLRSSRFEALDVDAGSLDLNRDSPLLFLLPQEHLMSRILKLDSRGSFCKKIRGSDPTFRPCTCDKAGDFTSSRFGHAEKFQRKCESVTVRDMFSQAR